MKKTLILAVILLPLSANALEFHDGGSVWYVQNENGSIVANGVGGPEAPHSLQEYEMLKIQQHNDEQNQKIIEAIQSWQNNH